MLSVDTVVNAITASQREFANAFLLAQYNLSIDVVNRKEFQAVIHSSGKQAFREALEYARQKKMLFEKLVEVLINYGYDDGTLIIELRKESGEKKAHMEGITNDRSGFIEPGLLTWGSEKGKQWTGKVVIGGAPQGSGVLIGPRRFLTAWHVVEDMFDIDPQTNHPVAKPEPPELKIVFDNYMDYSVNPRKPKEKAPIEINAAEDWLEVFSNSHVDEFTTLPKPLTSLQGYWDYAIIRLEKSVDEQRHYAELEARAIVPGPRAKIIVFQHPSGQTMLVDLDEVVIPDPPDAAIPNIRFLHQSNTDYGSSGGPCFDKEFNLVGIHQGNWPDLVNGKATNRGVPIRNIIEDIEIKKKQTATSQNPLLGSNPEEYIALFTDRRDYDPIIGIDPFQFGMLENVRSKKGYVITIQGEKGMGKTYHLQALFSLMSDADHLKIILAGELISKMDVVTLAKHICSGAGSVLTDIDELEEYNSAIPAWLRDEVVPKVIEVLDNKRSNRNVWLCFSNLNNYQIEKKNTIEFLLLLYEAVIQNPWLQIILDGVQSDLPNSLVPVMQAYTAETKTLEDIHNYFSRSLKEMNLKVKKEMVDESAQIFFDNYQAQLAVNRSGALRFLKEECKSYLIKLRNRLKIPNP